jgi:hypothetical protein
VKGIGTRLRPFEGGVALAGVAALAVVGPLRGALVAVPGLTVVASLFLFLAPGLLLARWFLSDRFGGAALVPVGFVLGVGGFALLAVPALILEASLGAYLWAAGTLVVASLAAAAVVAFAGWSFGEKAGPEYERGGLMWAPFVLLVGALAVLARITSPSTFGDIWIYLGWVRAYLGDGGLGADEPFFGGEVGLSRAKINGWLVEEAALSRVSGVDPVEFVFSYLNPTLVVVALLAFYALARVLLKSERAALFCGCLYALFFLVHLGQTRFTFGGEFLQRLPEDKLATKFLFLPLALAFAAAYVDGGKRRYLTCFVFSVLAVVAIHPIGFAIIGLSMAGFSVMHLAANPRSRSSWARICAMGLAGVVILVLPATLVPALTGRPLTDVLADTDINSGDPEVLRNMVFVSPERARIFEFADGSYMMHPSLLLDPVLAVGLVLAVPFLVLRARRSVAAQLLLGTIILVTFAVYTPPVTTILGDELVLPGQIWRLAWPIPLAILLALGWLLWEALGWIKTRTGTELVGKILPPLLIVLVSVVAVPWISDGLKPILSHRESAREAGFYPVDPLYLWLRDEISSPAVVLAPDVLGARIPAYSQEADVVSRRGGLVLNVLPKLERRAPGRIEIPRGAVDVRNFYRGADEATKTEILRRHEVDYVMVEAGSRLSRSLAARPAIEPVDQPSQRYDLYAVDRGEL